MIMMAFQQKPKKVHNSKFTPKITCSFYYFRPSRKASNNVASVVWFLADSGTEPFTVSVNLVGCLICQ